MTFDELKEKAHSLPLKPGVYIMQNAQSEVIYVGKAKALKNRVSQYFANLAAHTEKTRAMVSQIDHFDVIIADSEFEALILENSLIKRHQPRYNILLKDDKGYPYIRLSREEYPRFSLAGRVAEDGARYFGPYGSRHSTQGILDALRTALRLPSCRKKFPRDIGKERPCLNFHMGKCDGYCRSEELKERHDEAIRQAVSLLEGRFKEVKADLTAEMERAAEELRFEQAAQLRDRLRAIELLGARQKVVAGSLADTDVTGFFRGAAKSCFVVLHYVDGDLAAKDMELLEAPVTLKSTLAPGQDQELEALAGELEKINAKHLDSRIDLPATQKELRSLAQSINAMLERINRAYSAQARFVSDASHELRTPIAVIQGYAALLDRWGKDDPEALQESISAIRSEAKSMEELVEQLLFLARGDNDTQPVKPSLFDLSALAGEVLREEEMICPDRVFLPRWGEEPVPVRADQGLIKQVMRILMDNAIKYSSPGSRIYLRLSTQERYARLTVQDEGDGIPPESIPHIFERFYRTDQSRDRKTGGTGLGLSIARWIVERHEGWFEVVSRPGVGTRISFLLPLALPEQEAG